VAEEGIAEKLAPILPYDKVLPAAFPGNDYGVGIGLHDSSAALIPYQVSFQEPFVLISTGTWCISLNPSNDTPLTVTELQNDCLCYMHYQGKPVKASRLFAGQEHEDQVKQIAAHFNQNTLYFRTVEFNPEVIAGLQKKEDNRMDDIPAKRLMTQSLFSQKDLSSFSSAEEAYHQLIIDIVRQQRLSTQHVIEGTSVKRIFVDGGFSKNSVYMNLLATAFPGMEVFAASMSQATAMGTALALHRTWNKKSLPNDIIELKYYALAHA
jgi:sugar (pentulose or hexulose) kinase